MGQREGEKCGSNSGECAGVEGTVSREGRLSWSSSTQGAWVLVLEGGGGVEDIVGGVVACTRETDLG